MFYVVLWFNLNEQFKYGTAKFHSKSVLLARCSNLASVSNYLTVVGLKDVMTDKTETVIFLVQTEIPGR